MSRQSPSECALSAIGKPKLADRSLLDLAQADELVRLYKILASDTRLRLLHALVRADELCVTDLAAEVGMSAQSISNQLQRLIDNRIVAVRRAGGRSFYRVADSCVTGLLDLGLCLLEETGKLPNGVAESVDR
ncbi:MAG: winged helix-turn-helix transcriptional regulator [Chloroflexi bacterium]|nr:winged helix-turn-helix transcriptional regulator [Chloroflexota bacterium]